MKDKDLKLLLASGKPIKLSEEVSIHQPTVDSIIDISEDVFAQYLLPYRLNLDILLETVDEKEDLINSLHVFDLFFINSDEKKTSVLTPILGEDALSFLIKTLSFFTKVDESEIKILEHRQKIAIKDFLLDRESFDMLKKYIQEITISEDVVVEKPPPNLSPRKLDIYNKLMAGRAKAKEREMTYMCDMYVYNQFGGGSYICDEELLKMTYYKFRNAYMNMVNVESYHFGNQLFASTKFNMKQEDNKHWTETLKLSK